MTHAEKEVQRYMESYLETKRKTEDLKELYEMVFTDATGATTTIDEAGFVSSGYSGSIVESAAIMLPDIEDKYFEKLLQERKLQEKTQKMIEMVPDPVTRKVLSMTYLDGIDTLTIAREIGKASRTVRYRRQSGISYIAKRVRTKRPQ